MHTRIAALAVLFLLAHLWFLSPTLEDIDSINFALGVRDFDVAQHQPHPPGSPVFIALAKASTAAFRAAGIAGAESRAIAAWSALAGALLLPLVFALFARLDGDRRRAFSTAVVAAFAPLAWFTAARPMSDATGLALAVASQALVVGAWTGRSGARALIAGAFVAGIAAGARIQTAALTAPALAAALFLAPPTVSLAARAVAVAAALGAVAVWAIPLVAASGGLASYLAALGAQAGEDFEGVRMIWTSPTPHVIYHTVVNAFVWPWGTLALGLVVVALAAVGMTVALVRTPANLARVAIVFAPYAVFHLLLQESITMRYALPLVIPTAYLLVRAADAIRISPFAEIAVVCVGLFTVVPQTAAFGRGSPGFAAVHDAMATGETVGAHAGMRRVWAWLDDEGGAGRFLPAPHGYEWLALVQYWRVHHDAPAQFLANPKRTDHLVLLDREARRTVEDYAWAFPEWPHLGGARPGGITRIGFGPPGWMLDRGWAISAETAGITERDGYGPHRRPSIAWVRARADAMTLAIGGRHLGAPDHPEAYLTADVNGTRVGEWTPSPGSFFHTADLAAATFSGAGYVPLRVAARQARAGPPVRVGLEQFDLQPAGVPMRGFLEGWYEPEYNRTSGRAWRWMSERAVLWVRPIGRDVTLRIRGESPRRYYDETPHIRVLIGDAPVAEFNPSSDFAHDVVLPHAALAAAAGRVIVTSSQHFVPGDREGTADRRRLALRIYTAEVR